MCVYIHALLWIPGFGLDSHLVFKRNCKTTNSWELMRPYDAIICSKITNNFSFMVHQLTFMHKTMN